MFLDKENTILYVGKAKDLKSRVSSYFVNSPLLGDKTKVLVSQIQKIKITIVESELEALLLEAFFIKKFKPKYNIKLTDNKSYLRIRITVKDTYPKVLFARREDDEKSVYFGPYPDAAAVKMVLKIMRKIFPFQSIPNHAKRICLYNHLGLCPCPQINDSPELRKSYRKNIQGIIKMLEGESKKVMKELEKMRDEYSKKEQYEKAMEMQKKIKALSLITTPFRKPFEYDVNPNLRTDLREAELQELQKTLNLSVSIGRIECYDISNTQGTHAVGSMVVFVNGEKESSQYRKFKIRRDWEKPVILGRTKGARLSFDHEFRAEWLDRGDKAKRVIGSNAKDSIAALQNDNKKNQSNDFAMMQEVLTRRFTHDEWNTPDLIIVDGGKGQVSSAMEVLDSLGINIPLIGLAKREETIVIPIRHSGRVQNLSKKLLDTLSDSGQARMTKTDEENFTEISLPKNSSALHLIMRIRDEAHRFAITYHRKLRSKNALEQ